MKISEYKTFECGKYGPEKTPHYESTLDFSLFDLPVYEYLQVLIFILLNSPVHLGVLLDFFHCFPLFHDQDPTPSEIKSHTNAVNKKMDTCDK